jgi:hypothetical protein
MNYSETFPPGPVPTIRDWEDLSAQDLIPHLLRGASPAPQLPLQGGAALRLIQ